MRLKTSPLHWIGGYGHEVGVGVPRIRPKEGFCLPKSGRKYRGLGVAGCEGVDA